MARDIDVMMARFKATSVTARLCRAVCTVVPGAPTLNHFQTIEQAVHTREPRAGRRVVARARELSEEPNAQGGLWVMNALDTADSGIAVVTGVKTAVAAYKTRSTDALRNDSQQAADAVLKALGIAYLIHKVFDGSPLDRVKAFQATDSGKAILAYYAAIEIGLPFADNAARQGGKLLDDLVNRWQDTDLGKLGAQVKADDLQGARTVLDRLLGPLRGAVQTASQHLGPAAEAAQKNLPGALSAADKVAGVAATGADLLPVYRYLGARLVAEVCAGQALEELGADPDPPVAAVNAWLHHDDDGRPRPTWFIPVVAGVALFTVVGCAGGGTAAVGAIATTAASIDFESPARTSPPPSKGRRGR